VTVIFLVACGGSDEADPATERACDVWADLILEDPAPSDAEVAARLRAIDTTGVDSEVAGTITALAARLEDGVDISVSYERLSDLCF
jgi:hypothetical protein